MPKERDRYLLVLQTPTNRDLGMKPMRLTNLGRPKIDMTLKTIRYVDSFRRRQHKEYCNLTIWLLPSGRKTPKGKQRKELLFRFPRKTKHLIGEIKCLNLNPAINTS